MPYNMTNPLLLRKEEPQLFVIIAVGANLRATDGATALQSCERAVLAVASLPGVTGAVRSRWFSSAPVPPSGQPHYVNGAMRAAWACSPEALLSALQAIEAAAGRMRGVRNAARTLDLDIIDAGGLVQGDPALILPHPRAHLRGFVLRPLRDVAPAWRHPVSGLSVENLLAALPPEDTRPL